MADSPSGDSGGDTIDWQIALDAVDGRRVLLAELIEIFFEEYPKLLSEIETAIEAESSLNLQRSAHTLKGCLRYFGESRAARLAKQLEDHGRDQKQHEEQGQPTTFDGCHDVLVELHAATETLIPELKRFGEQETGQS